MLFLLNIIERLNKQIYFKNKWAAHMHAPYILPIGKKHLNRH